jgi:hypothetical protein
MDPDALLACFIHQKQELLRRAGSSRKAVADWDTAKRLYGYTMEKMAAVTDWWDFTPEILMEAVFAWAHKCKHPNGPMPNMLGSTKYLTTALSYHLNLPNEVIADRKGFETMMQNYDAAYEESVEKLKQLPVDSVIQATFLPAVFRYVYLMKHGASNQSKWLAQEVLLAAGGDERLKAWMHRSGYSYASVSDHLNTP